jgi:phosphatidylglycerophosphate synthase
VEPTNILVLADESANWKIAGLRQLERVVLAVNEFAESRKLESKTDIVVFWKPEVSFEKRWLPQDSRLSRCELNLAFESDRPGHAGPARALSTRLLVNRGAMANFISIAPVVECNTSIVDATEHWKKLARVFADVCREAATRAQIGGWRYITEPREIARSERWFLRDTGKTQDGLVSRFLNRPISRTISRRLLKSSLTPGTWTLSIFSLPIAAFFFLQRGDYLGFVIGATLFQVYSILDGCDGEIARSKYLESDTGRRFDTLCDVFGSLLFAIGLGMGLWQLHRFGPHNWLYLGEGIFCALMIAANEWLLRNSEIETDLAPNALTNALYLRHRAMIQRSGLLFLGEKLVWWLFQLTKRDVAIILFLVLAIAGRPQWILHLWTAVTAVSLLLALVARLRGRIDRFRGLSRGSRL